MMDDYNSDTDSENDFKIGIDGAVILKNACDAGDADYSEDEETDYTVPVYEEPEEEDAVTKGGADADTVETDIPPPVFDTAADDDVDDTEMLQKMKYLNKTDILRQYHPECVAINHQELDSYLTVVKDDRGNIVDSLHKTLPILTKYEYTRIIGFRTQQLSEGAAPYIAVPDNLIVEDYYLIAEEEFKQKKLPFVVGRPLPNGAFEYWRVSDLEYLR